MRRAHDVPDPGREPAGARAAQSAQSSLLHQARAGGHGPQPDLVLGHHPAPGPKRWTSFYLYVLLDIFSRCVVGWMVADRENAALAATLIEETCLKQGIEPQVLTLHSDRGAPMTSKCTAQLLADLGVTRSLSRPQVSDDNPFSRGAVQDPEVSPRLPWPLRRHYRRHRLLPVVLPLVQHRAPPCRDRDAHPR